MAQKRERRKQRRKKKQQRLGAYRESVGSAIPELSDALILSNNPALPKLSARIIDLARPELDELSPDAQRQLIGACAVAWNLSLIPDSKREEALREATGDLPPEIAHLHDDISGLLMHIVERKESLFPDDSRPIVGYEMFYEGDELRVNVMSPVA